MTSIHHAQLPHHEFGSSPRELTHVRRESPVFRAGFGGAQ
jgi:hypothetical protein